MLENLSHFSNCDKAKLFYILAVLDNYSMCKKDYIIPRLMTDVLLELDSHL